jgi:hypothetical protein
MTSDHITATMTLDAIIAYDTIVTFVIPLLCPADVIARDVSLRTPLKLQSTPKPELAVCVDM